MYVCTQCGQSYDQGGYCPADGRPLTVTDDPLIGTEIGRYQLSRLIGEGGMGRVYLGVQPVIGSRVAIKILADQCARSPELLERFFAEARAVNLIRHESIVSVLDMARLDDGRPYIVMEFVEGHTLGELVRGGTAPLGGVVQVVTEVLSALAAAHAIGIIHRDLKPDNVIVTGEGHAKVLDFGIAKLAPGLSHPLSPRTQTGALLGTPAYMAPEQIRGSGAIDARTDIYAAGIVLFEACTGRVPFAGETLFDLMRQHLEQQPPSPRALRAELPPSIEHVILTALAKHPDHRYATANDMADALHDAAGALGPDQWRALSSRGGVITGGRSATKLRSGIRTPLRPSSPNPPGDPPPAATVPHGTSVSTKSSRTRIGLAAVGIAAVVGIAIVAIAVSRSPAEAPEKIATTDGSGSASGPDEPEAVKRDDPEHRTKPVTSDQPRTEPVEHRTEPAKRIEPDERKRADPGRKSDPKAKRVEPDAEHAGAGSASPPPDAGAGSDSDGTTTLVIRSKQPPGAKRFTKPIDYNPKRFDGTAYAPKALALAQSVFPDAKLTRFDVNGVFPDGHADLTLPDLSDSSYLFRSPSHSARPTNIPANIRAEIYCYVEVTVGVTEVEVRVRELDPIDPNCRWPLRPLPRCSLSDVWKKAAKAGAKSNTVAKIGFLSDGQWFFDNEFDGEGVTESYADACP